MFYGAWLMFLTPAPLIIGWIGLHKYTVGRWRGIRVSGAICGMMGLLVTFIAGCMGILAFIQQGFAKADLGPVWFIGAPGLMLMLLGTLIFGIGFLKGSNFKLAVKIVPLMIALLIPFISYLRQPVSPMLEWGSAVGYALLEVLGVIFGAGWIILGLASPRLPNRMGY